MSSPPSPNADSRYSRKLYDLPQILQEPPEMPKGLPHVRHEFEGIWPDDGGYMIRGWAAHHEKPWTTVELWLNGKSMGRVQPWMRDDLLEHSGQLPNIGTAGFKFSIKASEIGKISTDRADIILYDGDEPFGWVWTPLRTDITEIVPSPPAHLMKRVIGTESPDYFVRFALTCFGQYTAAASKHRDFKTIKKMLDWGCGCGRVTSHYLRIIDGPVVTGCDIDGEDITWCQENLKGGRFLHTQPFVPLPFDENEFDLIVSLSVMTHLTKSQQDTWLREIDRILAPGGIFVCSLNGPHAARAMHDSFSRRLQTEEFFDLPDPALDGIAPEGYYRNTVQSVPYTRRSFGKVFDVLEVIESGVGIQDLVVARKSESPKRRGIFDKLKK